MADSILSDMLSKYQHRQEQYSKAGKLFYSPAYEGLKGSLPIQNQQDADRADLNAKKKSIRELRDFFNQETSSVKGARRVMMEQDKLIFGVDETGKPKKRMSYSQRTNFWSLAKEFEKTKGAQNANNYREIWNFIGEMAVEEDNDRSMRSLAQRSFVTQEKLDRIQKMLEEQLRNEQPDTTPNIFSGSWNVK